MGYARHTNVDVRDQRRAGIQPTLPILLGSFRHRDDGQLYEYANRAAYCDKPSADFAFAPELPHIVYMDDGSTLYARVMHTVVYVAVGKDEQGRPVLERWPSKCHRVYLNEWIMA